MSEHQPDLFWPFLEDNGKRMPCPDCGLPPDEICEECERRIDGVVREGLTLQDTPE